MASTLFLLSISLFPFIIHGAKENHQVIQNTCKTINAYQFADYDFCVSTLQARPARECATLLRIGWTSIELLMSNVTDTRRHIKSVLNSGKVQHWAMPCVTECYERYETAEILVESCLWKYRHTDFVNANFYAVALINSMVFCEEAALKGSDELLDLQKSLIWQGGAKECATLPMPGSVAHSFASLASCSAEMQKS
nr:putative invertase inhibitor [Ipomoea batatas]